MDLEKYFDTVPQSKLLEMISQTVKDGRVISLLYRFMKAGVMENGVVERSDIGIIFKRYRRMRSRYGIFTKTCKVPHESALKMANARQGFWAFSGYHMVSKWVSNNLLRRAGYTFLMDVYGRMHIAIL